MIPCSYWASACLAVLPSCVTSYVVSVRQARGLPVVSLFPHPASFRSRLAADTLAFGCILPTTGRIRDFHPLETCAAGRTNKKFQLQPDDEWLQLKLFYIKIQKYRKYTNTQDSISGSAVFSGSASLPAGWSDQRLRRNAMISFQQFSRLASHSARLVLSTRNMDAETGLAGVT